MKRAVTILNMEFYFSVEQIEKAKSIMNDDNEVKALTDLLLLWFSVKGDARDFPKVLNKLPF